MDGVPQLPGEKDGSTVNLTPAETVVAVTANMSPTISDTNTTLFMLPP